MKSFCLAKLLGIWLGLLNDDWLLSRKIPHRYMKLVDHFFFVSTVVSIRSIVLVMNQTESKTTWSKFQRNLLTIFYLHSCCHLLLRELTNFEVKTISARGETIFWWFVYVLPALLRKDCIQVRTSKFAGLQFSRSLWFDLCGITQPTAWLMALKASRLNHSFPLSMLLPFFFWESRNFFLRLTSDVGTWIQALWIQQQTFK